MNKLINKLEKLFKINRNPENTKDTIKLLVFKSALICIFLGVSAFLISLFINIFMIALTAGDIYEFDEIQSSDLSADCAIILGCQVLPSGHPSTMLRHRLETGAELYFSGKVKKIIVSGDHGADHYDESNTMKDYLIELGIPSEDIFMDHAGFSTYDSMKRAKEVFGVSSAVIVTQRYHLYRAMYIGKMNGIEIHGASASLESYGRQWYYDLREYAARCKDFLMTLFNASPVFLGEKIDIGGSGDVTNDK
ncbi:MAG: SanA protein [Ruminococcaceae bacterium]|nr:SanA protein [Oscillospiraceae bacterium]